MGFFKTVTQGGQVHLHQLRMLKQIFIAGILGALLGGSGFFAWQCQSVPYYAWQSAYEVTWAKFMFASTPDTKHETLYQMYTPPDFPPPAEKKATKAKEDTPLKGKLFISKPFKKSCLSILKDPLLLKATQQLEQFFLKASFKSLQFGTVFFVLIMALWYILGRFQKKPEHKRGNTMLPWNKLSKLLQKEGEDSDLAFEGLPLMRDKETSHFLITGTTGSGKTNAFNILLPQIRARGDRAIVLDVTGDYVSRYYNEDSDLILNPLDIRSEGWHPWADCNLDSHYDVFAEAMIQPKDSSKDPFWDNASRAILKTALRKFASQDNHNVEELYTFLLSSTDREFEAFFKYTEAATFAIKNNEKTTHSIRSVLSSQIEVLRLLEPTKTSFSIRNWVMENNWDSDSSETPHKTKAPKSWLFITARPDQRETLRPLISAWIDIALNALMVTPNLQVWRLWFIIDELAALQKLPRLLTGLSESRKYGGCLLVGFQSKPQLDEIYGKNSSEAMLDLFNTKFFFRCTEPSTQQWISKVLGDKEEGEPQENISYGAHHMRDGVSLSRHTKQRPLVLPSELAQLNDLACYIRLPGDTPITKIQAKYRNSPLTKIPFLLKTKKERVYPGNPSNIRIVKKEILV